MRKAIFLSLVFLMPSIALAQVPTSGNVFFGYSYFNTNLSPIDRANANGWEATLEGKFLPWVGIIADFDAHYGSQNFPLAPLGTFNADFAEHNYLFGPRVSVGVGKFRPFAEAMLGAGHVSGRAIGSDTSVATGIGGGIDYRVLRLVGWRFQGNYIHTHLLGLAQSNLRLSTGIVIRF